MVPTSSHARTAFAEFTATAAQALTPRWYSVVMVCDIERITIRNFISTLLRALHDDALSRNKQAYRSSPASAARAGIAASLRKSRKRLGGIRITLTVRRDG